MYDQVWETARGEQIPVSQMETSHIMNCIRKIQRSRRNPRWREEFLPRLQLELEIRNLMQRS